MSDYLDSIEEGSYEESEDLEVITDGDPSDEDLEAIETNPLLQEEEIVEVIEEEEEDDEDVPNMYTLQVDGEDVEVTLDELLKGYGTTRSAAKKFQDAAYTRKQSEELINRLQTDPMSVLRDPNLNIDVKKMVADYATQQLELEAMSDEQRELMQARKQLAQMEEERKQSDQSEYERQMGELTNHHKQQYTSEIHDALEADGLPITESTVRRMAQYMSECLDHDDAGVRSLGAKDITALVREDYIADFKSMFGSSDAETLEAVLGDDMAKVLRKADVAKLTNKNNKTAKPAKAKKGGAKKPSKKFNQDQFDDYLDSL